MEEKKLKSIIMRGETEKTERKPSLSQINEIIETISAFANLDGGTVLVGISNSGKVLGVYVGKDTIERLTNKISQSIDPVIYPRISLEEVDGKKIILIDVDHSSNTPHLAFGRLFRRVGNSTLQASRDEFENIVLKKHTNELSFDSQI